ncbi:hypothetical protein BU17DRAFT_92813 [Hysterangium stoloniferum]|nr:hypothetical protein BU17DRAFT_92813 [Hysterangium stoloniferum]
MSLGVTIERKAFSSSTISRFPPKKPRLTHFISLPIGHHAALHETWNRISTTLLGTSPPIPGLDESIIIRPGSLHITLGVLSLNSNTMIENSGAEKKRDEGALMGDAIDNTTTLKPADESPISHTVKDALNLLHSLRIPIMTILNGEELMIPLESMDVMRSKPNQSPEQSHVLWAGPDLTSEAGKRLATVCNLIHSTFKGARMLQDDRPLKLHCTLINTVYRKNTGLKKSNGKRWGNNQRVPFSFPAVVSSPAMVDILQEHGEANINKTGPLKINLGTWSVFEVQLCEMGSKTDNGAYRHIGAISLQDHEPQVANDLAVV